VPLVNLTGANPIGSVVPLGQAAAGLAVGQPGEARRTISGLLSPAIAAPAQFATGIDMFTGGKARQPFPGIAGALANIVYESPQGKLIQRGVGGELDSPLYGKRDLQYELLRYLGVAPTRVNAAEARNRG
jgi:hypothetical protein